MKQIAIIILLSISCIGCQQEELTEEQKTTTRTSPTYGVEIITIDGCQYIKATEGFGATISVSIIHKANCPNHGDTTGTK